MSSQNRGNGGMNNLDMIDGINRDRNENNPSYINSQTMKEIGIVNEGLIKFAKTLNGSLDKYNKLITKSSENLVDSQERLNKNKQELDNKLAEMGKHYFGANKKYYEDYKKQIEMKKEELDKDFEELRISTRKEFLKQSFKNESESKQINYLDNQYSKGNNLFKKSNEYYSQLEKLKSDALETYGEGFDTDKNNKGYKEYKKALMNLNENYAKEMKDSWKEDFKENHKVLSSIGEGINKTFEKNKDSLMGILGPLNLILSPLKDFFGGFGTAFKILGTGIKKLFTVKFNKKNPSATDVMKSGAFGVGSLFIANKLEELMGGKDKTMDLDNGLSSLLPESLRNMLGENSSLMNNLKIISGLGAGLLIIKDFVQEFANSGDWRSGLSKAFTGTSMQENAVKGALLGFTIGGPVGALIGALGGIALNYFSPQVETFIRRMTLDKSQAKKDILAKVEKDVQKGKRQQQELDIYNKLATYSGMSDADFADLSKGTFESKGMAYKDWIRQYAKGNFDILSNDDLKYMSGVFLSGGNKISNELGIDEFKNLLNILGGVSNDLLLEKFLGSEKELTKQLKSLLIFQNAKGYDSDKLARYLKANNMDMEDYQNYLNILPNLSSADIETINSVLSVIDPKNKTKASMKDVNDAIIRTDGSIIKTNPKDTLVALKNIPLSLNSVKDETNRNLNDSLSQIEKDENLENKLVTIIDVLSQILAKDIKIQMPPQTRNDLDILMTGGMI